MIVQTVVMSLKSSRVMPTVAEQWIWARLWVRRVLLVTRWGATGTVWVVCSLRRMRVLLRLLGIMNISERCEFGRCRLGLTWSVMWGVRLGGMRVVMMVAKVLLRIRISGLLVGVVGFCMWICY